MKKGTRLKIVDRIFGNFSHCFRLNETIVVDRVWMDRTYFCHSVMRPNQKWWCSSKEVVAK